MNRAPSTCLEQMPLGPAWGLCGGRQSIPAAVRVVAALSVLALLALASCAPLARHTEELQPGGPLAAMTPTDSFTFAVIGDTRTGIETFKENIKAINHLNPDFVVDVGDLIDGYQNEATKIEAMWDEFDEIVSGLTVPLVMVAGNHDIWSLLSREIYMRRYGRTFFSFNHKCAHFVVLDTERFGPDGGLLNRIDQQQLQWLEQDLRKHRHLRPKFVFLHKPFFQSGHVATGARTHWDEHVHPLLARYGVDAVFAGHVHVYCHFPPVHGVHYYITGGGGAGLHGDEAAGGFHHFMVLTVRGANWIAAVVRTGGVEADDVVTIGVLQALSEITNMPPVRLNEEAAAFSLNFRNIFDSPMHTSLRWITTPESGYRIEPLERDFEVSPRDSTNVTFTGTFDGERPYPLPTYTLQMTVRGKEVVKKTLPLRAVPCRTLVCKRTDEAPQIDGTLDDACWQTAIVVRHFGIFASGRPSKFHTSAAMLYDNERLYFGVRCPEPNMGKLKQEATERDSRVYSDDSVELFLDCNADKATYVQLIVNPAGRIYDAAKNKLGPGMGKASWNAPWQVATSKGTEGWTVEGAIDLKSLGVRPPTLGQKWGFNLCRSRRAGPLEMSCWSLCYGSYHEPQHFGTLVFE